ncbi:F-box cyclin [Cordyceps militaris]|uniref:F-box cyclin n=1 Tax=Cordyceps militaris TaxID=73501 RepID=A0A2H4SUP9_CORMI|nr:F-box cyclin [Cordyceps militaris]
MRLFVIRAKKEFKQHFPSEKSPRNFAYYFYYRNPQQRAKKRYCQEIAFSIFEVDPGEMGCNVSDLAS